MLLHLVFFINRLVNTYNSKKNLKVKFLKNVKKWIIKI